jgi:hypothetical protein
MICPCGNQDAIFKCMTAEVEYCDRCSTSKTTGSTIPDVYFKGAYWDPHIATEENPGPKFIATRAEKAYWLKKCNLREAGDRVHGASSFDPISHRHARESLRRPPQCPTA